MDKQTKEDYFIKLTDHFYGDVLEKLNKHTNYVLDAYYPSAKEDLKAYCSGLMPYAVAVNVMKVVYANNSEDLDMDEYNFLHRTINQD